MDCQDWQCQAACRTTSACMQDMQAVIAVGSPSTSYYFLSVHTYEHRLALVGDARLNAQTRAVVGSLEESRLHCRPRGKQSVAGVMEGTHGDALGGVPVEQLQDRAPEGAKAPLHFGAQLSLPRQRQVAPQPLHHLQCRDGQCSEIPT